MMSCSVFPAALTGIQGQRNPQSHIDTHVCVCVHTNGVGDENKKHERDTKRHKHMLTLHENSNDFSGSSDQTWKSHSFKRLKRLK